MRLTHLGHSAVLVEAGTIRILLDPGNFSSKWHGLADLDVIVATHLHPDHFDSDQLPVLLKNNPQARLLVCPDIVDQGNFATAQGFPGGSSIKIGSILIEAVGRLHAIIHRDIPRIGNVGVVISEDDGPRFFHPGDCLETIPTDIDVLAVPAHGPWCAMKETIDFVRAVNARYGFLIHDGLINQRGWALTFSRLCEMTSTVFTDIRDGQPLVI